MVLFNRGFNKNSLGALNPLTHMFSPIGATAKQSVSSVQWICAPSMIEGHDVAKRIQDIQANLSNNLSYNYVNGRYLDRSGNDDTAAISEKIVATTGIKDPSTGKIPYANYVRYGNEPTWYIVCASATEPFRDDSGTNTTTKRDQRTEDVECDEYCRKVITEKTMYLSETPTETSIPVRTEVEEIVCDPPDRRVKVPCEDEINTNNGGSTPVVPSAPGMSGWM